MITGLQTLRVIGLAAAFAFTILVLPAVFVGSARMFQVSRQAPSIAMILVAAVAAALAVRWVELREEETPRTADELALTYRTRFLTQAAVAQAPGLLAFFLTIFSRPFPGIAVLLGVTCTAILVAIVGPTEKTLGRLDAEARERNINGDVRGALDQLYSWRP